MSILDFEDYKKNPKAKKPHPSNNPGGREAEIFDTTEKIIEKIREELTGIIRETNNFLAGAEEKNEEILEEKKIELTKKIETLISQLKKIQTDYSQKENGEDKNKATGRAINSAETAKDFVVKAFETAKKMARLEEIHNQIDGIFEEVVAVTKTNLDEKELEAKKDEAVKKLEAIIEKLNAKKENFLKNKETPTEVIKKIDQLLEHARQNIPLTNFHFSKVKPLPKRSHLKLLKKDEK